MTQTVANPPKDMSSERPTAETGGDAGLRVWTPAIAFENDVRLVELAIIAEPDPEGGYSGHCPCFPGCVAQADTLDDLLVAIKETAEDLAAEYKAAGESVPLRLVPVEPLAEGALVSSIRLRVDG